MVAELLAGGSWIRTRLVIIRTSVPNATPLSAPTARIGEHVMNRAGETGRIARIRPQLW